MNNLFSKTQFRRTVRHIPPRLVAALLALGVSMFTILFLTFLPDIQPETLFIAGLVSFLTSFFLFMYAIDLMIFSEVKEIYEKLEQIQATDLQASRKKIYNYINPIKKLNDEVFVYMSKKQKEIDILKQNETYRREFLANISHELKTPIFAAQGFIHTLLDGAKDDPEVAEKFLNKAARSLDGLDALVRDLMAVAQIESGDLRMNFESVNATTITQNVFEQLEELAQKSKVTLVLKKTNSEPHNVIADPQRLAQVMTNLVENGIKYNQEGGRVTVKLQPTKKHVEITVSDNGPGIAEEHLPHVFERFYRADKSRSRATGGTGLGLAIVKHILKAHQSNISVTSKLDKGTTFVFKLDKAL